MATRQKKVRSIPSGQESSAVRAAEAPTDLVPDVRSTVETHFRQMDEAHDRIRAQELTARLTDPEN
jgi:hypothetical protein